jgi:hypothetical protein
VTVAIADALPPAPVAVAVYVVVAFGVTDWVPPFVARVYELPSLPVTVTWVASVAATVNVDEDSALMVAGLALMETVGAGSKVTVAVALAVAPPLEVATAV